MRLCIGITGENGAGKSTVLQRLIGNLERISIQTTRFSDILTETLALWGIQPTRQNLQLLPQVMNKAYGEGSLSKAMALRISSFDADIVIVDGVRWISDMKLIRSFPYNKLIYVTAPAEVRFNRIKTRNEKVGERDLTWEQFLAEDSAPNEVEIPRIGMGADFKINNNLSQAVLINTTEKIAKNIRAAFAIDSDY